MKIDWTKVKEGFTIMDVLIEENKELREENERLNNIIAKNKYSADELNEIERLNNIINATIEYINNSSCFDGSYMNKHDLLMLLSGIIVRSDKE